MDHLPDVIFVKDADSRFVRINRASADLWGIPEPADAIGKTDFDFAPPEVADNFIADDRRIIATGESIIDRLESAATADGTPRWLLTSKFPIRDGAGRISGLLGIARDVTERKRAEAEIRLQAALLDQIEAAVIVTDLANIVTRWNGFAETLFGWSAAEATGRHLHALIVLPEHTADAAARLATLRAGHRIDGEFVLRRRDGSRVPVHAIRSPVRDEDGAVVGAITVMVDLSERRVWEERLRHLAFHDPLTDLPNRLCFMDKLQCTLERSRDGAGVAVLFLDLDRFKIVNDSLGHAAGDHLLRQVVGRLSSGLRPGDVLARFGGDEFTILLEGVATVAAATVVADRLLDALAEPFTIDGREAFVSGSIGIAWRGAAGSDAGELLREADVALYQAKGAGRGRCAVFDAAANAAALTLLARETDLRRAIERDEFVLHYQPFVDLTMGDVAGFEALIRWRHPREGLLQPVDFVPLAEETGLIIPIGAWALMEACRRARTWRDLRPDRPPIVAINVSPRQIRDPDFGPLLWRVLAETNLSPSQLKIEVTEDALGADVDATTDFLYALRAIGVRLALDDFGTGYSSLGRIHQLPLDVVKIDRSFIANLESDPHARAIVRAVAALAHDLGLTVTAEGIETFDQLRAVRELGCAHGQGFLFAPALSALEAERFLRAGAPTRLALTAS